MTKDAAGPGSESSDDLVAVLVELRNTITPLVEDLVSGVQPPAERWLMFAEAISAVIPLFRQQVQHVLSAHAAGQAIDTPPPAPPAPR